MSPNSECYKDLISLIETNKEVINHLGFKSIKALEDYIIDNGYHEFSELRSEIQEYVKKCVR